MAQSPPDPFSRGYARIRISKCRIVNLTLVILVNLDSTIDGTCEPEASQEANTSAEDSEDDADHSHVAQVDDDRQEADHVKPT